ncbi:spore coat protein U domain-containing protein [Iodobacter ciconiae]|uniref:SCPU domain-containing protein n=1 Tax=Iodobacter ciconiae TaxID=2496266 RepID=A0A3S8ZSA5_9NEIS|nr:spore coat protein U domain-containing protein [Iodobacter ciconiae]AZN36367.1 SCPU domain-containing protein [Iodobacter ciconiae]
MIARCFRFIFCLFYVMFSFSALAESQRVSAEVVGMCAFSRPNDVILDFGGLTPGQGDRSVMAEVSFSCSKGTRYKVELDNGLHFNKGQSRSRKMANTKGGDFLPYLLQSSLNSGTGHGEAILIPLKLSASVRGLDYLGIKTGSYSDLVVLKISP